MPLTVCSSAICLFLRALYPRTNSRNWSSPSSRQAVPFPVYSSWKNCEVGAASLYQACDARSWLFHPVAIGFSLRGSWPGATTTFWQWKSLSSARCLLQHRQIQRSDYKLVIYGAILYYFLQRRAQPISAAEHLIFFLGLLVFMVIPSNTLMWRWFVSH